MCPSSQAQSDRIRRHLARSEPKLAVSSHFLVAFPCIGQVTACRAMSQSVHRALHGGMIADWRYRVRSTHKSCSGFSGQGSGEGRPRSGGQGSKPQELVAASQGRSGLAARGGLKCKMCTCVCVCVGVACVAAGLLRRPPNRPGKQPCGCRYRRLGSAGSTLGMNTSQGSRGPRNPHTLAEFR